MNIKYSTAKHLCKNYRKKGSILRWYEETPKKYFKIVRFCAPNSMKRHKLRPKVNLQKELNEFNQIVYALRNESDKVVDSLKFDVNIISKF